MITFKRNGTKLQVNIESGLAPTSNVYNLSWECGDECYAALLRDHLDDKLGNLLEAIRRQEYERGFNDHKKRQPKEEWFRSGFYLNK